jgi:hypothetical protein
MRQDIGSGPADLQARGPGTNQAFPGYMVAMMRHISTLKVGCRRGETEWIKVFRVKRLNDEYEKM